MKHLWLGLWLLLSVAAEAHNVSADRLTVLSRGANITGTFERKGDLSLDLDRLRTAGFRHVRVFVESEKLDDPAYVQKLDRLVDATVTRRLGIILCMIARTHPWQDNNADERFWTAAWSRLAAHYARVSPHYLFPEIANEPSIQDGARWSAIQDRLRGVVREKLPQNTILLTGSPTGMVWSLPSPSTDTNVVYTWHLYQPMIFTHQGADWSGIDPTYVQYKGLMYPPDQANMRRLSNSTTEKALEQYGHDAAAMMHREIDAGRQWAKDHDAAVMVDEFGVYRAAPQDSRANWLKDARTRIENAQMGWTVWEYDGGFGITPLSSINRIMAALGLSS